MFAIDPQRDGNRFIARVDESLTAFLDLERGDSGLRQMIVTPVWGLEPDVRRSCSFQGVLSFGVSH
jgi:hypothetical protein